MRILIGIVIVVLFSILAKTVGFFWAATVFVIVPSIYALLNGYESFEYQILSLLRTYKS